MNDLAVKHDAPRYSPAIESSRVMGHKIGVLTRDSVAGFKVISFAHRSAYDRRVRLAQLGGRLDQRVEHRLQIKRRAADDFEHVRRGGLLLQRLPQLVEQAGVFDGDDGLGGEILDQLDLFVGERPHLLAKEIEGADQLALLQHWNAEHGTETSRFEAN